MPPPLYNDSCYFEPHVNFTHDGTPLQGISSDLGFSEAGHLCLEVPECHAVIENSFANAALAHVKRYVLRGAGELQNQTGTTTLVRSRNHCAPPSPPALPPHQPPPPPPPSFPTQLITTRPLYLVSFTARVETTVEAFDVAVYANRMSTRLGGTDVGVTVSPGSVIVTTQVGADSQAAADGLVTQVTNIANDESLMTELYGAPSTIDTSSMTVTQNPDAVHPPPSAPPTKTEEEHSLLAIAIISAVLLPVGAFLVYLHYEHTHTPVEIAQRSYAAVTTADMPTPKTTALSFKFEM